MPEYLHETRMTLGMDIETVARLTQIPEKYLLGLEEGNYELLPADVYVQGYLRSLGAVYHVSADLLIKQFGRERGLDKTVKPISKKSSSSSRITAARFSFTPRSITVIFVVLVLVSSLSYLAWQLRSVSAAPDLTVLYPDSNIALSSRNVLLRGETELGSRVYVNGQEILVDEAGEFREVINLTEGTNRLVIVSRNKFGNETTLERVVVVSSGIVAGSFATSTDELLSRPIVITVTVGPDPAWINIRSDSMELQNGTLDANTTQTFAADSELLLTTGNAGSTRVEYNGKDLGILGESGEVITDIRFTP